MAVVTLNTLKKTYDKYKQLLKRAITFLYKCNAFNGIYQNISIFFKQRH